MLSHLLVAAAVLSSTGVAQAQGPATATAAPPAVPAAVPPAAPRVGLVLGGGGARGAAHVGVLEVLERLRVPVACVAGTSMGALVAGAWAAGLGPAGLRAALAQADWADMFVDNPDYSDLNFRAKRLAQRFLPGSEVGVKDGGLVAPPGVVSGQKIKLFFNQLVGADRGERRIEDLPLPVSIIATDIGNGERVVLRDGSLTEAMRASMSVPGLLAPLEYRGRKLVDGGLVDNLPVREVRERCGADVVIAVSVGSPPLPPEQVSGLLSVTTQMVALLTEQNVQATLASLRPTDVLIAPALGPISSASFERHAEAADLGRAAAEALAHRLAGLGVDAERYAAWERTLGRASRPLVPRVDEVQVAGLVRADEQVVRRDLGQREGAPLDTARLERDILRAYGDGWYERVDYAVLKQDGRQVLRLLPVEKSWGPDYLRLGLRLDSSLSQGSTYQLRVGHQRTWLNALGGELLLTGDLGSATGAAAEWFQPLARDRRWFADAAVEYRRERVDYWLGDQRIAQYRSARSRLELVLGHSLPLVGQLRAGWRELEVGNTLDTGVDVLAARPQRAGGGWVLALDFDQFDRLYFPSRGWSVKAEWFDSPRRDHTRASVDLRAALPIADWVLGSRAAWTGTPRGVLPVTEAGRLGGFLNLSAFASGQFVGEEVALAQVRAERIIGRLPLGLRGDMRLGVAFEGGRVGTTYFRQRREGWLGSLAVYLGGDTPVGPVYLGIGHGSGGATNAYLVIGTP
ncbi:MAG: patatin-like phospholipase family protein [Pseudomonadota bacterium]